MAKNRSQISLADFLKTLTLRKYSCWAEDLDQDTLEALLWVLGEFGKRAGIAHAENVLRVQIGDEVLVNWEGEPGRRIEVALQAIIDIVRRQKMSEEDLMDRISRALHR